MLPWKHLDVRTTLTLDSDVAAKIRSEARRSGKSFKAVVNEALREGLGARRRRAPKAPFKVHARALGLRPGLRYDDVGELLERIEGPSHR